MHEKTLAALSGSVSIALYRVNVNRHAMYGIPSVHVSENTRNNAARNIIRSSRRLAAVTECFSILSHAYNFNSLTLCSSSFDIFNL